MRSQPTERKTKKRSADIAMTGFSKDWKFRRKKFQGLPAGGGFGKTRRPYGSLAMKVFMSRAQSSWMTWRPERAEGGTPPPGSTHWPAM